MSDNPIEEKMMENGFDHPCRETCSGWKQGRERGVFDSKAEIARLEAERDEAVNRYANEVSRIPKLNQHIDLLREQRDSLKAELEQWKTSWDNSGNMYAELRAHADKLAAALDKIRYSTANNVSMDIAFAANEALADYEKVKNGRE